MNDFLAHVTVSDPQAMSVLVVEDSLAELSVLVAVLDKLDYRIHTATNGHQALEIVQTHPVDIVLSDWRMPGMDGFALCRELHKEDTTAPYFILLTARDAKCDLIAAMDAGADDFISKPYNREELRVRLKAGRRIVSMRKGLQTKHQQIEQALQRETRMHHKLQSDLAAAEKLQRSLLPRNTHQGGGFGLAHFFKAANGVAGDAYNVIELSEHLLGFYHIDVAGHGVRAAMHSFSISRLLASPDESLALKETDPQTGEIRAIAPHRVISALNARFQSDENCRDYYTMIYGVIDSRTGEGVFSQAGMPMPLLLRANGQTETLGRGGFPVGMFEEATYEDVTFTMADKDRLMLHSDGLFTCQAPNGAPLDQKKLAQWIQKLASLSIDKLHQRFPEVMQRTLDMSQADDDISLLLLERRVPVIRPPSQTTAGVKRLCVIH